MRAAFWAGALAVGGISVAFAIGCDWGIRSHFRLLHHSLWVAVLLPPVGLALVAWLSRNLAPGSQGSGIPQVIAVLELPGNAPRKGLLSLRIAFMKVLLTILGLLCGASIGREGPSVHVGASVMDAVGRYTRIPSEQLRRGLVLAGGAAGLAAAFNTPIAGIVFAVEELARSFEERTTGTLLTAVVLSGMVSLSFSGNYTYFGVFNAHLPDWSAWWAVPVCGIVGGFAGGIFASLLIQGQHRLAPYLGRWGVEIAAGCGLAVAVLGLISHGDTFGTGYEQARSVLRDGSSLNGFFPLMKACATLASYWSGIPGGIFSPTLSVGAGLGADLAPLLPHAPFQTVILLGMAAYFVGVIQSPLTGAVIVMEMVDDHQLIVPMLATVFLAAGASRMVCPEPIYRALAAKYLPPTPAPNQTPTITPTPTPTPTQTAAPAALPGIPATIRIPVSGSAAGTSGAPGEAPR